MFLILYTDLYIYIIISYLQQTLDPLPRCHDAGGEDAREPSGRTQLTHVQLLVGGRLQKLLADAVAHETESKDWCHAHYGGSHTYKREKGVYNVFYKWQ